MYRAQLTPDYGADFGDYDTDLLEDFLDEEDKLRKSIRHRTKSQPKRTRVKRKGRNRTAEAPIHGITHRRNRRWDW